MLKNTEVYLLTSVQVIPLTEDATPEIANSVKRLLSLKVWTCYCSYSMFLMWWYIGTGWYMEICPIKRSLLYLLYLLYLI